MSEILTIKEVAELLKVSERTVRNLIEKEEILAYRIGSQFRIKADDLNTYIEKSKVKGD